MNQSNDLSPYHYRFQLGREGLQLHLYGHNTLVEGLALLLLLSQQTFLSSPSLLFSLPPIPPFLLFMVHVLQDAGPAKYVTAFSESGADHLALHADGAFDVVRADQAIPDLHNFAPLHLLVWVHQVKYVIL